MSSILVTGGAGFIGSHLVDSLISKGHTVRIFDNLQKPVHLNGKPEYLNSEAEFVLGDVRDKVALAKAMNGIDVIFHEAAYQDYLPDFSTFFNTNTVGTALLYEIAVERKLPIRKIIVASSQAVYGEGKYRCEEHGIQYPSIRTPDQLEAGNWNLSCEKCSRELAWLPTDELRVNPQNQYAISKFTQEMVALNLGRRYGIPSTCLRYSIVQGPRQSFWNAYSGACRVFSLSYFLRMQLPIYEDGNQVRDYVNINDVVDANVLVMHDSRSNYGVYNVGGGKAFTVLQFAKIVAQIFKMPFQAEPGGQYRFGDTRHIFSDITKLQQLGWNPKYSPDKSALDYKRWLESQEVAPDIIEQATAKMKALGVVRAVRA